MTQKERERANAWLDRMKAATTGITEEQKIAIIKYSRHVVWKKVDDDFDSLINDKKLPPKI